MRMIELKNVAKEYPSAPPISALENISCVVNEGEFVTVVGPSGCGKTTLLKLVGGLLEATRGEILVEGTPVRYPEHRATLVFQDYNRSLFPWRSVIRNVLFPIEDRESTKQTRLATARKYLEMVGLTGFERNYPWELSGGMQQRVAIARALAYEPRVLLMDEPFGSLDARMSEDLQNGLLEVWTRLGLTILFVTHDIDDAIYLADRVVVLTARPATVGAVIDVELARPRRQLKTRSCEAFLNYRREIYGLLGKSNGVMA